MHLFDDGEEQASSPREFDNLLSEFAAQSAIEKSPQYIAEALAVWKALAVLCPERLRQEFIAERQAVKIDDYEIALKLKIPEFHVPRLLSPAFDRMLERIAPNA